MGIEAANFFVDLGIGHGFDERFDPHVSEDGALGVRLIRACYEANVLRAISSSAVINSIASESISIIILFDEHGQYLKAAGNYFGDLKKGRKRLVGMIDRLGA
jgi:hypothetical protein